ncbi:MAG: outer membrane lipoprotein-sorting protein [bacterium]
MRRFTNTCLMLLLSTFLNAQTADEIIKKAEEIIKGTSAYGKIKMTVVTPEFTRALEMDNWWIGNEKALIVIRSPKKEAGNKTLKIGNEMWNYLKNTEMTIKIPPSMMLQSWNGSDFTNDDLVRESNLNDDYNLKIIAEEEINGAMCWKIELLPKPEAPVVWGKLYYWVRQNDFLPSVVQYFDEKEKLIRYMVFSDIKNVGNRTLPAKWSMYNKTKPGNSTTFEILDMQFNIKISERIFSFSELERGN